jgi:hypothetical protein
MGFGFPVKIRGWVEQNCDSLAGSLAQTSALRHVC